MAQEIIRNVKTKIITYGIDQDKSEPFPNKLQLSSEPLLRDMLTELHRGNRYGNNHLLNFLLVIWYFQPMILNLNMNLTFKTPLYLQFICPTPIAIF